MQGEPDERGMATPAWAEEPKMNCRRVRVAAAVGVNHAGVSC